MTEREFRHCFRITSTSERDSEEGSLKVRRLFYSIAGRGKLDRSQRHLFLSTREWYVSETVNAAQAPYFLYTVTSSQRETFWQHYVK
jgi:hypothetical protein